MVTTYTPFCDIIEAAKAVLVDPANEEARQSLSKALAKLDELEEEQRTYAAEIEAACERYKSDDIEIDDIPLLSVGDDGVFVNAWVFVEFQNPKDDEEENEEEI